MYLLPYTCNIIRHPSGKTIYTLRILQEGDAVWQETDTSEALKENGLVSLHTPCLDFVEGHACLFVPIDETRTDLSSMYTAEELDPSDKETHRWCTYRLIVNTADNSLWLPPPPDATIAPFTLAGVLRHILKACGVELLNGGWSS